MIIVGEFILFWSGGWQRGWVSWWVGGEMKIKLTSVKVEVEVEAELGNYYDSNDDYSNGDVSKDDCIEDTVSSPKGDCVSFRGR